MIGNSAVEMHALIDEAGEFVAMTSQRVLRRVSAHLSRDAIVRYLVTNLGWIEVKRTARWIKLRCRPSIVSDVALASALFELADHPESIVALSVLGSEWQHQVHASHSEVATMLDGMRGSTPAVMLRRVRAPTTSRHYANALSLGKFCSTPRTAAELMEYCSNMFVSGRWSMSHFDPVDGRLVMDHVNGGYTRFNSNWVAGKGVSSLDGYAGRDYSNWVAQTRAHAVSIGEPIFDDVDATVPFPGFGYSRLLYARATIPVRLACGNTRVISTSVSDTSIRLKVAG